MVEENNFDELVELPGLALSDWQSEIIEEIESGDEDVYAGLAVIHREWTVQTIVDQVRRGNIQLDPPYQRRSVWNDRRRSLLIDSLIVGLPVPEIMLAEIPGKKGKYAVIDGKQRLQSITGFLLPDEYPHFWGKTKLSFDRNSKTTSERGILSNELQGKTYADLTDDQQAQLENASIRCTFLTNYKDDIVLYTLFHRLNTQSTALNMQELRQALYHGEFSKFITESTDIVGLLHQVMGLTKADNRLRDAELLLRYIAMALFAEDYKGNLRRFLDDAMHKLNKDWQEKEREVKQQYDSMNRGIRNGARVLGDLRRIGRRVKHGGEFDKRFNKVLFEAEVYYFAQLEERDFTESESARFIDAFEMLVNNDNEFSQAIGDTTKGLNEYRIRYSKLQVLFQGVFGEKFNNPFPV